ncbi:MAG TPA: hypothetical protein DHW82_06455 [Spirochaetia bacterium]|nr:MAG: hypothetical protein A2Y41_09425 [Spirochaetes bacterium GWB1_36_13]HCL56634.1 hypothetical protein [Spirochaetia bacterium]
MVSFIQKKLIFILMFFFVCSGTVFAEKESSPQELFYAVSIGGLTPVDYPAKEKDWNTVETIVTYTFVTVSQFLFIPNIDFHVYNPLSEKWVMGYGLTYFEQILHNDEYGNNIKESKIMLDMDFNYYFREIKKGFYLNLNAGVPFLRWPEEKGRAQFKPQLRLQQGFGYCLDNNGDSSITTFVEFSYGYMLPGDKEFWYHNYFARIKIGILW